MNCSNCSTRSHKKCWSVGLHTGKKPVQDLSGLGTSVSKASTQQNTFLDSYNQKDLSQEFTLSSKSHARTYSDCLIPCNESLRIPKSQQSLNTSRKTLALNTDLPQPKVSDQNLTAKVAFLEARTIDLQVELASAKQKNAELQEVISHYDSKIGKLLCRTTDSMGRVLHTKNSEISRLETRLSSNTDQFAAKLEAETHRNKELEKTVNFYMARKLERTVEKLKAENERLKEETKELKVKWETAEIENETCRKSQGSFQARRQVLSSLQRQLSDVEKMQTILLQENAVLKSASESRKISPVFDQETILLCRMVARLRHLVQACREGNLVQILKGPGADWERMREDGGETVTQGKKDVQEIETQLLSWYSDLCGHQCQVI